MIPVNEPLLDGRERQLLAECVDTGWISSDGPFVRQFEEGFSSYLGARHGIAVSSGTAALETALFAAGVGEGDEVIMPSFTIISCAVAAIRVGARPVFVDIDPDTWCIDVEQIEAAVTSRTKALMPVHMYGHPCDMDPILEIAEEHGLTVLEDAAQVHGAEYKERKCGSIGHLGAFSFYANKILTTGEGGMVVTSDDRLAERARSYRNLCFGADRRFLHTEVGNNYRLTNLQAAVGVAQLERLDEFIEKKRRLGGYYGQRLSRIEGIRAQIERPWAKAVYWMYCVELDTSLGRSAEDVMGALKRRGIGTRPFFLGLHEQPVLKDVGLVPPDASFPVTERAARLGFYLPSGLTLTNANIDESVDALAEALSE